MALPIGQDSAPIKSFFYAEQEGERWQQLTQGMLFVLWCFLVKWLLEEQAGEHKDAIGEGAQGEDQED